MTAGERALDLAMTETAAARDRLTRIYGRVPAVVLFTQREMDGPVRVGRALRLAGAVERLHREAPGPVIVAAVVPGGQALEHWFRRRWPDGARGVITDARFFGTMQATAYEGTGDIVTATVATVRALDPFLADLERLWRNGATYGRIAAASCQTVSQVQDDLDRMRSLGFALPHRQGFGRRSDHARARGV